MGMTITEKNMARHAGLAEVKAGQMIECQLDFILMNDITFPPAKKEFEKIGKPVFDADRIYLVPDHFTPNKDIKSATQAKVMRDFVRQHKITHYFEVGRMGIEHVLLPEQGLIGPGEMIIGADSHTCTYGALNAFATGVGSTDAGVAMAEGKTMADRLTICNMAIEAGGKCGVFPYDAVTEEYIQGRITRPIEPIAADEDADYCQVVTIQLDELTPVVAYPHLPSNTHYMKDIVKEDRIQIDQVIIGSCTNGRFEDLEMCAEIFKGRKVADFVRCIVIPGSQDVYNQAVKAGLMDIFIEAGCAVSTPTCGPCLGGYMGIMAEGERTVSTTNRNFRGRMGHVDSEVYLASPYVAAASAVAGYLASPEEV